MAARARRISYSYMMDFALFETAIGRCGIVWSERGIAGVQLPERGATATRNRLLRRFPAAREHAPPAEVRRAIDDIVALLGGERRDLNHVTIDIGAAPEFHRRVYEVARRIPAGGDTLLRRSRRASWRPQSGPRRRRSIVAKSLPHHRALSSGPGGLRQARRLFRPGRRGDKAPAFNDRGRAAPRSYARPHAVRPVAIGRGEAAALTAH